MREDRFTNTPEQAAAYEAERGRSDDPDERPTRLEIERDEAGPPWSTNRPAQVFKTMSDVRSHVEGLDP